MIKNPKTRIACIVVAALLTTAAPLSIAQSKEEARAAAVVELLIEQKAAQERAAIDSAKRDLIRNSDTSKPGDTSAADTRFAIFIFLVGLVIVVMVSRRVSKVMRLASAKKKLEKMTPNERKKFFEDNPDL